MVKHTPQEMKAGRSERDPRIDPQPGDVLERSDGPTIVTVTVIEGKLKSRIHYELLDKSGRDPIYRIPLTCNMPLLNWRKWAASATVVRRGEG